MNTSLIPWVLPLCCLVPLLVGLDTALASGESRLGKERARPARAFRHLSTPASSKRGEPVPGRMPVQLGGDLRMQHWIEVNIAPGVSYWAVREHLDDLGDGRYVWSGRVKDEPVSRVTISVNGAVVSGSVVVPTREGVEAYAIEPTPSGLSELMVSDGGGAGDGVPSPTPQVFAGPGESPATAQNPAVVDVLVLYTPASRNRWGVDGLLAKVDEAIAYSNQGYANSGVFLTLNLVQVAEVGYSETGVQSVTLDALANPWDGQMDEAQALRDQYAADVVVLISEDTSACGLSFLMSVVSAGFADYAYSVVSSVCLNSVSLSFPHELGHLLGCQHDRASSVSPGAYAYSYGYRRCAADGTGWRTIMSYDCAGVARINYYSTPLVTYGGFPLGVSYEADPANAADNARSLNQAAHTVANFRSPPLLPPAEPTGLAALGTSASAVVLSWSDNGDTELSYRIERSPAAAGPWVEIFSVPADTVTYVDNGLTGGALWYYRVRAFNAGGYSAYSNTAYATTDPDPIPVPAAPSGLSAAAVSFGRIHLNWADNATNEVWQELERSADGVVWTALDAVAANVVTYIDAGVRPLTTYHYRVRSRTADASSAYSNQASATTPALPSATLTCGSVAGEDGYVRESGETTNVGGGAAAGAAYVGDSNRNQQYRGILSFDTSAIPDGAGIRSATLRLQVAAFTGTSPFQTHGTCLADVKSGSGFGGSPALAAGDFQAAADVLNAATLGAATGSGQWCSGSLSPSALGFVNKTGRTQFRVRFAWDDNNDLGNDYVTFNTAAASSSTVRPQLIVEYVTEPALPAAPVGLAAEPASLEQIALTWTDAAANEAGFAVERSDDASTWRRIATLPANAIDYLDSDLATGCTYYYRVAAFNDAGCSAWAGPAAAIPQTPPTMVSFTSVGAEDGSVLESSELSNVGGTTLAGTACAGDSGADSQYKFIVSFDTSAVPDDAEIVSVKLSLLRSAASGTSPFDTHGVCWVDLKGGAGFGGAAALAAGDFQAAADAVKVGTLSRAAANNTRSELTLSTAALGVVNKTGRTQFRVYFEKDDNDDLGEDSLSFATGSAATAANRPQLIIKYNLLP